VGGGGWRFPAPTSPSPAPAQQRARETVRAAVAATIELLERHPDRDVTLEAIRLRSGVSQGSLTHHFGNREGLVAAAQVERYVRSCADDEAFLSRLDGMLTAPEPFAATIIGLIGDMLTPRRRETRWIRLSAIAASYADEALRATISHSYTALTDHLTAIVAQGNEHGLLLPDVDVRTVALLTTMHAQGLVLDDIVDEHVTESGWFHIQVRFVSAFLTAPVVDALEAAERASFGDLWRAETIARPGRVPVDVADRLAAARGLAGGGSASDVTDVAHVVRLMSVGEEDGDAEPDRSKDRSRRTLALAERLLELTVEHLIAHGAAGFDAAELRSSAGMGVNTYHRIFGGRDGLLRAGRTRIELHRSASSVSRFTRSVAEATDAAAFRGSLEEWATALSGEEHRRSIWQRIETIAASRTDPVLRAGLARIQRITRDLLIEQVRLAQQRDLIDPELPPAGVARFLDGNVFWHVFHELDERRPDRAAWSAMLQRISRMLCPDPAGPSTPTGLRGPALPGLKAL